MIFTLHHVAVVSFTELGKGGEGVWQPLLKIWTDAAKKKK